ncbi:ABC transporter substrate-binding protein [Ramlibacter sp. XY19]|uniref:ABC transporter substrate-binding protein n=1 Tax=Ramlibacter paludis TaxID=2908000 RepID=UPI0023DA428D|nr:ABC transporter substrate-binding protein [Ramlibacter paludis]MCG2591682.1 ABC transporter substrate-binding protein [Ramlibacter paludis]
METNKIRRRGLLAAASGAALAGLAGCAATVPLTPQPISVISFGGGFNLPLWAARDQGFFAKHGLVADLQVTPDSKNVFNGLMEGRYQVAITAFDNIVAYQEGQGELKFDPPSDFFAFMGSDDGFLSLVAVPEVKSVAQLKGKTVSVDAMSNGFSFALREMLARNGVAESDVKWARAGGTDRRFAALMERQHDATMLRAPFDLQATNRGFNQLATAREVIGPYLGIVGAARRSWAREHPAQVVAFIRAYRDAVRWLEDPANRSAAEALLVRNVPNMSPQIAQQSAALMLDPKSGFFADAGMEPRAVQAVLALRGKLGEPARTLDNPDKYLDRRYWREAMAR